MRVRHKQYIRFKTKVIQKRRLDIIKYVWKSEYLLNNKRYIGQTRKKHWYCNCSACSNKNKAVRDRRDKIAKLKKKDSLRENNI